MQLSSVSWLIEALLFSTVCAQAPNTLSGKYPTVRTESTNGTYMLVPLKKSIVQAALPSNYSLLDASSFTTVFPNGFPSDMHPVMVITGEGANIQQQVLGVGLNIPFLMQGLVNIPFVDRLKDGKTPFIYPYLQLIGGNNGQIASGVIPALVGTLEGTVIYEAEFSPDTSAYKAVDPIANPGLFTTSAFISLVQNPVSGPSPLTDPAYEIDFSPTSDSPYTAHTFHSIVNQPEILFTGQCLNNVLYFNNPYADPFLTNGSVTLYAGSLLDTLGVGLPKNFAGTYSNVFGYAATAENVGFNPVDCATAAANVDPAAAN